MDMIKLISVNNDELKNEALNIYLKNDYYFSKISDNLPSIFAVEEDMKTIKLYFKDFKGKHPELFTIGEIKE